MDLTKYKNKLIGNEDERAVSPVIGVILMVAITVILAAVIAAFVLDIGDLDDSAPNAQFDWENTSDSDADPDNEEIEYTVTHTSGDDIDNSSISVGGDATNDDVDSSNDWGEEVTAGDEMVIENLNSGDEVIITWESDGSSTTLTSYDG